MKRSVFILATALAVLVFTACSSNKKPLECSALQGTEIYKEKGMIHLKSNLQFSNPNSKEHQIKRLECEIYVNQKLVGEIIEPMSAPIPSKGTYEHSFELVFAPEDVYPGFLAKKLGSFGTTQVKVSVVGKAISEFNENRADVPVDVFEELQVKN